MCVHLKPTALHAFIWKGIYSNTPFSVLVYCLYCTQKNICSPYSSISSPPPILFFYITGDMRCITHSTILREEMVVGFIDHLSCHLQRLEWRTEAIFELMRVERWWRKNPDGTTFCGQWSWNEWSSLTETLLWSQHPNTGKMLLSFDSLFFVIPG